MPTQPGLPVLAASLASLFGVPNLLTVDGVLAVLGFGAPQWGVYDQDNNLVLTPDSIVSLDYRQDWRISNYPIEQGGFFSYNKVATPFEVKVRMSQGGSESDRADFLDNLQSVAESLDLYNVITPEVTYFNVNVENFDYRRTSTNGVGLILADVHFLEIREAGTSAFAATSQLSGANQVNDGAVQTTAPTTQEESALSDILGGV